MADSNYLYEITYIVSAVLNDDQIKGVIQRVKKTIEEGEGDIVESVEWGNRRLAFPIKKKRNGFYVNLYVKAPGTLIPRLERAMEIDDDILRYITLRMDTKMIKHYEQSKKPGAPQPA
jgi:small subunit ribosomal protein S6